MWRRSSGTSDFAWRGGLSLSGDPFTPARGKVTPPLGRSDTPVWGRPYPLGETQNPRRGKAIPSWGDAKSPSGEGHTPLGKRKIPVGGRSYPLGETQNPRLEKAIPSWGNAKSLSGESQYPFGGKAKSPSGEGHTLLGKTKIPVWGRSYPFGENQNPRMGIVLPIFSEKATSSQRRLGGLWRAGEGR